jgi:hypothetical protein
MPHVFALSGAEFGAPEKKEGERCRWVKNPRTGCESKLCFVGKSSKSKTGWAFTESKCPLSGLGSGGSKRRKKNG